MISIGENALLHHKKMYDSQAYDVSQFVQDPKIAQIGLTSILSNTLNAERQLQIAEIWLLILGLVALTRSIYHFQSRRTCHKEECTGLAILQFCIPTPPR